MAATDPTFFVRVSPSGRNPEPLDQGARVRSLEYQDCEGKADKLKLTVDNYDLSNFDAPVWKTGNHVEVAWGYPGNLSPVRQMKVQKVTGSLVLTVECLDESVVMMKVARVRSFERSSYSAAVRAIAAEYGFGGRYLHVEDTGEVLPQVTQARMTDAQFIRQAAARYGFEFYVDFDGFHFHPRRLGQKPIRRLTYFTEPGRGDIISWNAENDVFGGGKAGAVTVKGRDPMKKQDFSVRADNSTETARTTLAPGGGLRAAVGAGKVTFHQTEAQARAAGSPILPTTERTEAGAKKQAQGAFAKAQMQAVQLTLECVGDPQMLAKSTFEVAGVGKVLSGLYYATEVTHKVGAGYTMTIKAKRDGKASAEATGPDFARERPGPEEPNRGKRNELRPDEDDPTKSGGPAPLTARVEGGRVTYQQGGRQ